MYSDRLIGDTNFQKALEFYVYAEDASLNSTYEKQEDDPYYGKARSQKLAVFIKQNLFRI